MPASASSPRSWARWGPRSSPASSRRSAAERGDGEIRAHYGYADGSGEYYLIIDTDRCDGCGACVDACPQGILEVVPDDYDDLKAAVKPELGKTLSYACLGYLRKCSALDTNCHSVCEPDAIEHTW